MSIAELKNEIHKAVDKMPERDLKELLDLINKKQYWDDSAIEEHVDAIISENKELLQKLAQ
ncbi:hypothetical protein LT679_06325 [Mucilaginibacter roseus]|uniref:Uncharacterized protein n=1 Tax=Mucilaginibacter roseus TaxID=1528868 RepID=A0ABS8U3W6_9SPHI|nr:hypothetical protein [Mucilaginibacter roseus]MCD8740213.1 hypothetical protein [Mucilaginibacter roseus]